MEQSRANAYVLFSSTGRHSHIRMPSKPSICTSLTVVSIHSCFQSWQTTFMSSTHHQTHTHAFISSRLDYCNSLLTGVNDGLLRRLQSVQNAAARLVTGTRRCEHITQHCGSCTGYLCCNVSSTSWRVLPSMHCRVWRRITLPATVSWLQIPYGDPCGPPSDVSALCHVRTALSAIDPSRLPVHVHGTSCRSVYVTLGYR